jgi:hypothetical protein
MKRAALSIFALLIATSALALTPATDVYLPALARGPGNGGSLWRADAWIFNPSSVQSATVDIYFLKRQSNTNPDSRRITLAAGETRYLPDIFLATFNASIAAGALRVVSNIPVVATGRSFDANVTIAGQSQVGTTGQFFAGTPASQAFAEGEVTDVIGLDQDGVETAGRWRSNLSVVETTGNVATFELQRLDGAGNVIATRAYSTLQPREVRQINYVITDVFGTTGTNQRIRVHVTQGPGRVIAAASRIDNLTGDPSTVEMAGAGRDGTYTCKQTKNTFDSSVTLTVAGGAVTVISAVILFTDEDAGPNCSGGELLQIGQTLLPPALINTDGTVSFAVSGAAGGVSVTLSISCVIDTAGKVQGTVTTTLTGSASCSATKSWPLVGAKLQP